ncbi:hypothetical protein ACGANB_04080 [Salmonella enterica subsp. enterica serovar Aberdeen]|uniref:hypothetical protein n=1 Tax=Salmonella enterica TaxID=28901 RepID=UPI00370BF6F3
METVFDALKAMGKASAREVAARLKIEPVEALEMLREQEEIGAVTFINGYWNVAASGSPAPEKNGGADRVPEKTLPLHKTVCVERGAEPALVTPQMVVRMLAENGSMKTTELAGQLKRNPRGLVLLLRSYANRGLIVQNGSGKGVTWSCVPAKPEAVLIPAPEVTAKAMQKSTEVKIPVNTESRVDNLLIPAPRFISAEIRRTEGKLKRLLAMREVSREVHAPRNRKLWKQIYQDVEQAIL